MGVGLKKHLKKREDSLEKKNPQRKGLAKRWGLRSTGQEPGATLFF
jgi:hypothetical protein